MRCLFQTLPDHTVYHPLHVPCMFQLQEDSPAPGDLGPIKCGPGSITLKGLHSLAYPHQSCQPHECPALGPIQLWVQMWSIQVASQPLIKFCKNSSLSPCLFFFLIYFYNGVQLIFIAVFLASIHPLDALRDINKFFFSFYQSDIFFSCEQSVLSPVL